MAHINPVMDFRLKLEIGFRDGNNGIIIADEYGDITKGLDISFDILKTYETKPQTSKITIYNLSTETYNLIYEKADAFRLSCARGKDQDYVPFYTGYPIRASQVAKQTVLTSNEGFMAQDANAGRRGQNDLETEITLMNYGFAEIFKSYQTDVTGDLVINDCINALGLPKGNIDKNVENILKGTTFKAGLTIRGEVSTILNMLGKRCGFNWNTNDMTFNIYAKNRDDIKAYGIELNPNNSSTPERQNDKVKSRVQTLQKSSKRKNIKGAKAVITEKLSQGFLIRTQLLPHLQCGSTCRLNFDMADAKGDKYIYRIRHHGDNIGLDAYTDIYCL